MRTLTAYEQAYNYVHERQLAQLAAQRLIYCLCGREFPLGEVGNIRFGVGINYADNRCPDCRARAGVLDNLGG